MPPIIKVETILVENLPRFAQMFGGKNESFSERWNVVTSADGLAPDGRIRAAGWDFFFIAAEVKSSFFGRIRSERIQGALNRILAQVKDRGFNGIEVTGMVAKSFMGMPYTVVSAHSRHLQQGGYLESVQLRRAAQTQRP